MTDVSTYLEQPAPPALAGRVVCTWRFRQGLSVAPVRVLPDGHIDLIWDGRSLFVAGPDTAAAMAHLTPGLTLTGLRLAPGAGAGLLGLPLHELTDQRVAMSDLWGLRGASLERVIGEGQDPAAAMLAWCAGQAGEPDGRMRQLFRFLARGEGVRVTELAATLGYSERSLRRHCLDAFGYGPKTLDRILRLQRFLRLAPGHASLTSAALAAGYADAPHLVRDSQQLTGLSPGELVAHHVR